MNKRRVLSGINDHLVTVVAVAMSLYHLITLSHVLGYFGCVPLQPLQHRAISLSFIMVLLFLVVPAGKKTRRDTDEIVPWYDWLLIVVSIVTNLWVVTHLVKFMELATGWGEPGKIEVVFCILLVVAILEACRRTMGWAMVSVALFFLLHVWFGHYLPGILYVKRVSIDSIVVQLYASSGGIYGIAMAVASTIIVTFIIFGAFLNASGAGEVFINLSLAIAGRFRGGPAKVSVIASSLMATMSGSGVANVATTGVVTIPMMKKIGYKPEFAGAVEAVASNGGQIMPPVMGAVAFLIAEVLEMPYYQVITAAFLPAVIYYVALFMMVDLEAAKTNIKGLPPEELPSFWKTLADGWLLLTPIAFLIFMLVVLKYEPQTSCVYSVLFLIIVASFRKKSRMGPKKLIQGLKGGGTGMIEVGAGCAAAGLIIFSVMFTGLGFGFSLMLTTLAGDNLFLLLVIGALASFVLGMGLSSVPCYITLSMLVGPALIKAGIAPIAAHLFFFYWGILSFITPPVAVSAFFAGSIAGANLMKTGWTATRLGIVSYLVPFIFVYSPALLMMGEVRRIIVAVITAILGATALAAGLEGYLFQKQNWIQRILMVATGVLLITPGWKGDAFGIALAAIVIVWQLSTRRRGLASEVKPAAASQLPR